MVNSISVATHVYNQRSELKRFLEALESEDYKDELVVVVIGGEDPYDLLEIQRPFSVKALYMEKPPCEKAYNQAKKIARAAAQGQTMFFLDVTLTPSRDILTSFVKANISAIGVEKSMAEDRIPRLPQVDY